MRRSNSDTRLARARLAAGLSQTDLAALSGVSYSTIAMVEASRHVFNRISVAAAMRIATVLGVDVTELMEDDWRTTLHTTQES